MGKVWFKEHNRELRANERNSGMKESRKEESPDKQGMQASGQDRAIGCIPRTYL